jgi:hypothetical protein
MSAKSAKSKSPEFEFKVGDAVEHPRFGSGRIIGGEKRVDLVRIRFREGLQETDRTFKRHILASLLSGEGVPYHDRHPDGVCISPSTCDQPAHNMRLGRGVVAPS